jgi:hypothetical protein
MLENRFREKQGLGKNPETRVKLGGGLIGEGTLAIGSGICRKRIFVLPARLPGTAAQSFKSLIAASPGGHRPQRAQQNQQIG